MNDFDQLLDHLRGEKPFLGIELRPPRIELSASAGMDAWIDTYHTLRRLTLQGRYVFMTDRAVGREEEENLRHLAVNLGPDVDKSQLIQFLTAKHSLEYCLSYPGRALEEGFRTLVVLGGDRQDDIPRCVEHALELRDRIRQRFPDLLLGGWINPLRDPVQQVEFLSRGDFCADFYLTQVVSHYDLERVREFLEEARRRGVSIPGIFGVFYYRSANRRTLETLSRFLPVPEKELLRDFGENGLDADTICSQSIQALWGLGVRNFYISNFDVAAAGQRLRDVLAKLPFLQ
ncbi:MAG: methylenetetrahydrofolate reductase [Acidobacteria bacterium]|nr:methylenetetrahydrofolate reductase [Acidobacteriota bacterium]